jgi:hypothetical protein
MIVLHRQGEDSIEHSDHGLQVSCIYIFVYKGEDIIEHTNNVSCVYILICNIGKILLDILINL